MPISLKKAYRACLWLAEHKIGVPVNERQGQWDLTKENDEEFSWQRSDLVAALPLEYYENSIYSYDCGDGIICIDASNIIDGPLFTDEIESTFERFSPNRNREFFHPARDEIRSVDKPQNIEKLVKLSLPMCMFDDEKVPQVESVNKATLASLMAHNTLIDLLKRQVVQAKCEMGVVQVADFITNSNAWDDCEKPIPASFWNENPIPNYEHSAVEQGISRVLRMIKHFDGDLPDESFINQCEFWYKSINISDSFENWHMERVRKIFSSPVKATFKLSNGKYLIQYGSDDRAEIKTSEGLTLIHKIMKEYKTKESNIDYHGLSPLEFEISQLDKDIDKFNSASKTKRKSEVRLKKYIRKQQNMIYWLLCTLHDFKSAEEYDEENENSSEKANKIISKIKFRVGQIKGTQYTEGLVARHGESIIERYIDMPSEQFYDVQNSIKESLSVKFDNNELEFERLRKNIANACDKLVESSPHIADHLGLLHSKSKQGLGYTTGGFYYASNDNTVWDFG